MLRKGAFTIILHNPEEIHLRTESLNYESYKHTELGAKEALEFTWKTVAVEFGSNAAACGIGALGEALDWSVPVTIMLSLATGITVSGIGNKLLFRNAEGVVIQETVLDDEKIKMIEENLEGGKYSNLGNMSFEDGKNIHHGVHLEKRDCHTNK